MALSSRNLLCAERYKSKVKHQVYNRNHTFYASLTKKAFLMLSEWMRSPVEAQGTLLLLARLLPTSPEIGKILTPLRFDFYEVKL